MAYDALVESLRLLQGAPPADEARLSRRVRHVPLAVDRDGDAAATLFLRRGVSGVPLLDVHVLLRTGTGWRLLGGGGGPGEEALRPRPRLADAGGVPGRSSGSGGTARASSPGPGDDWVGWAVLHLAAEVAALRVAERELPVPGHGSAVVVWTQEPPAVTAQDAAGAVLGPVPLRPAGPLPREYRDG